MAVKFGVLGEKVWLGPVGTGQGMLLNWGSGPCPWGQSPAPPCQGSGPIPIAPVVAASLWGRFYWGSSSPRSAGIPRASPAVTQVCPINGPVGCGDFPAGHLGILMPAQGREGTRRRSRDAEALPGGPVR